MWKFVSHRSQKINKSSFGSDRLDSAKDQKKQHNNRRFTSISIHKSCQNIHVEYWCAATDQNLKSIKNQLSYYYWWKMCITNGVNSPITEIIFRLILNDIREILYSVWCLMQRVLVFKPVLSKNLIFIWLSACECRALCRTHHRRQYTIKIRSSDVVVCVRRCQVKNWKNKSGEKSYNKKRNKRARKTKSRAQVKNGSRKLERQQITDGNVKSKKKEREILFACMSLFMETRV